MSGATPVFLFGFERSGTTLFTMMVGAHPRLSCPLSVASLVDDLIDHERLKLWKVPFDRESLIAAVETGSYPHVVRAFHEAAAEAEGKPRWVNMDIATLFRLEEAVQLFPDARFVQIVRDGRDVAISFKGYRFGGLNALEVAEQWSRATVSADRIGSALGPQRYLRIRYEDLILSPEATLDRFCDFLGEQFDPAMLAYGDAVAQKVPDDKRDLWPVLDRPPQTDKVDRWRREMGAAERYVIEEAAGEALERFGYERSQSGFSPMGELRGAWCYLTRGGRLKRLARKA